MTFGSNLNTIIKVGGFVEDIVAGEIVVFEGQFHAVFSVSADEVFVSFDGKTLTGIPKNQVRKTSYFEFMFKFSRLLK